MLLLDLNRLIRLDEPPERWRACPCCVARARRQAGTGDGPFAAAIQPHVAAAFRLARAILGSDDLGWDAVQEALLSLWRQPHCPADVGAWLARAVRYRALHLRRTRQRRRRHEARAAARRGELCDRENPARRVAAAELLQRLRHSAEQLPEDYRQVFALRAWQQLDYDAIAARLALPIGTVRSRLHRCREALRRALGVEE